MENHMHTLLMIVVLTEFLIVFLCRISLLSPFAINAFCWFCALLAGALFGQDYNELSYDTLVALNFWIIITGMITFIFSYRFKINSEKIYYKISLRKINAFFCIIIFLLFVLELLREIYIVGSSGDYGFFLNLRMAAISVDKTEYALSFSTTIYPIMLASLCVFFVSQDNDSSNKKIIFILLLWNILYSVATMSKFWFLSLFIIVVLTLIAKNKLRKKSLFLICGFVIIVFYCFNLLRTGSGEGLQTDILYQALLYLYSPIVALNHVSSTVIDGNTFGEYTFSFIYNIGKSIGILDGTKISGILPYVNVPIETNIYTALQPFMADFDFVGVVVGAIFYGLFYSMIFRAINFRLWAFPCYLTIIYSLALQFITETLLMNLSGNIKAMISAVMIFSLLKMLGAISTRS